MLNVQLTIKNTFSFLIPYSLFLIVLPGCSTQKQILRSAEKLVLKDSSLSTAHVGISIFDPAANKYLFNWQGDHYFVPASNVKLATCYAAMKYLGDSLVGLRYGIPEDRWFKENAVVIKPTADPTFLHQDFKKQPVLNFFTSIAGKPKIGFLIDKPSVERWGNGWSWNDYEEYYMAERNIFPILGNVITLRLNPVNNRFIGDTALPYEYRINLLSTGTRYFDSLVNKPFQGYSKKGVYEAEQKFSVTRDIASNSFHIEQGSGPFQEKTITFVTHGLLTAAQILDDTLKLKNKLEDILVVHDKRNLYFWEETNGELQNITINEWHSIHSQPTDSVLKPMMHNSDNFFAEQMLLMVSNERLGIMNDEEIIDTLLKTDFKGLPQKPNWVDGCGLSRYNLFTPQDFVTILYKMKNEFGMDRIKNILATGNEGTLEGRYKTEVGYIFAKTGTLSGVIALSGFLYTKKNKLLIFSVLVNNHNSSATAVRNAVERFIKAVRDKY